jgi:hypothetical protein
VPETLSTRDKIGAALGTTGLGNASTSPDFEVEPLTTLAHSYVARVRIKDANGQPSTVIFKRSAPGVAADLAQREARFYRGVAPLLPAGLTPRCRFAEEAPDSATLRSPKATRPRTAVASGSPRGHRGH